MATCPSCHLRLPLGTIFGFYGPVVCPHCYSELDFTKSWWRLVLVMVAALTAMEGVRDLLEINGVSRLWRSLGGLAVFVTSYALLYLVLVRYRLREPPLSIRRPPNTPGP